MTLELIRIVKGDWRVHCQATQKGTDVVLHDGLLYERTEETYNLRAVFRSAMGTSTREGPDGELLTRTGGPRPGWKMPEAPECDDCGRDPETDERVTPAVMKQPGCHCEDGWELFWWCAVCDDADNDGLEIDWPFLPAEYATVPDMAALGFTEVA